MKAITVRLDDSQEAKVEELERALHNSAAGVVKFAIDQLFEAMQEKKSATEEKLPAAA